MLVTILDANLSDIEKTGIILIRGWSAIDTENVAYLRKTSGRGKYGLPKFILCLPCPKPESIQVLLKENFWPEFIRSVIRAWSLDEAICTANKRLPRMIEKRARWHP